MSLWYRLVALLVAVLAGPASGEDWPQYRHDARHTGVSAEGVEPPLTVVWQLAGSGPMARHPAVLRRAVYAAAQSVRLGSQRLPAQLYRIDARTGDVVWRQLLTGDVPADASPAVTEEAVFLCAPTLLALDPARGQLRWQMPRFIEERFQASALAPVWEDDGLHADATSGALVAEADGRVVGAYPLQGAAALAMARLSVVPGTGRAPAMESPLPAVMAVGGGRMFLTSRRGMVWAVSQDGRVVWRIATEGVASSPSLAYGALYFTLRGAAVGSPGVLPTLPGAQPVSGPTARVVALEAATGRLRWAFNGAPAEAEAIQTALRDVAVTDRYVYVSGARGQLFALRLGDGRLAWKSAPGGAGSPTAPAVAGERVWWVNDGQLQAFNAETGRLDWSGPLPSPADRGIAGRSDRFGPPVVAGGLLFVAGGHHLLALGPARRTFRMAADVTETPTTDGAAPAPLAELRTVTVRWRDDQRPTTNDQRATTKAGVSDRPNARTPERLNARTPNTQHPNTRLPEIVTFDWLNESRSGVDPPEGLAAREGLGDARVRGALLRALEEVARTARPAYLDLAPDVNVLQRADAKEFERFWGELPGWIAAVRRAAPETRIVASVNLEVLDGEGRAGGPYAAVAPGAPQWELARRLAGLVDALGVSSYPGSRYRHPGDIPGSYLLRLREWTRRPLLLTDTGWPAPAKGGADLSAAYVERLFQLTYWLDAEAVAYRSLLAPRDAPAWRRAFGLGDGGTRTALDVWRARLGWRNGGRGGVPAQRVAGEGARSALPGACRATEPSAYTR